MEISIIIDTSLKASLFSALKVLLQKLSERVESVGKELGRNVRLTTKIFYVNDTSFCLQTINLPDENEFNQQLGKCNGSKAFCDAVAAHDWNDRKIIIIGSATNLDKDQVFSSLTKNQPELLILFFKKPTKYQKNTIFTNALHDRIEDREKKIKLLQERLNGFIKIDDFQESKPCPPLKLEPCTDDDKLFLSGILNRRPSDNSLTKPSTCTLKNIEPCTDDDKLFLSSLQKNKTASDNNQQPNPETNNFPANTIKQPTNPATEPQQSNGTPEILVPLSNSPSCCFAISTPSLSEYFKDNSF